MADDPHKKLPDAVTAGVASGSTPATGSGFRVPGEVLPAGTRLANRYQVLELLGQGGMGAVYKALDLELDRTIALKTIRSDLASHPELVNRFKHELILARQVTHRNVTRIYDFGDSEGVKFITMEYVEGQDLRSYLQARGKLPVAEVLDIMLQICRGLEAAHAEGVIHRDLKPQNVLRQPNGRVQVMDFGLARSLESEGMTVTGAVLGTLEYMSPEQAVGQPVGPQSDIFAIGVIFYELLTGENPYKAETSIASLIKRTQERPKGLSTVDPAIPAPISDIVQKCLEPAASERYQSVGEVIRDLEAWTSVQKTSFGSASALPRAAAPRARRYVAAAAAVLLLAGAAALWFYFRSGRAEPRAVKPITLLVADFENKTGDPVFDGTLESSFALSLEGATFINAFNRAEARKIAAQIKPDEPRMGDTLAQLVADREGIDVVVGGAIERTSGGYRLQVRAYDAGSHSELSSEQTEVRNKGDVLKTVDRLAAVVRRRLGDTSDLASGAAAAETYTASSLEAAHEYSLGQQAKQAGKYDEAIRHYQEAIRLDPAMGRAYAGLAVVYSNQGEQQKAEENYRLALQRLNRMTEREKYRTRGGYYLVTRNADKALDEMEELVRQYPADSAGVANLALAYFYRREMQKALEYGEKSVLISPKNVEQRNNLGLYAMYAGENARAVEEQKKALALNPGFTLAYVGIALPQLASGDVGAAMQTYSTLAALGPKQASIAALGEADALLYSGRYNEAITRLRAGVQADEARKDVAAASRKQIALAEAYLLAGRKPEALASAEAAALVSKNDAVQVSAARIFAALGKDTRAAAIANQLAARIDPDPQAYANLVRAEMELARGRYPEAVRLLKEARRISDAWLVRFDLGLAYLRAGAFAEANSEFETCLRRQGESTALFLDESPTMRAFPAVYYYLGKTQQALGDPGAAKSFETFLGIMKQADPNPLVDDARKSLAAPR